MSKSSFEWDEKKNLINIKKHGVSFEEARYAFADKGKILHFDNEHSSHEKRFFCYGFDEDRQAILTVRFTYREPNKIRIFGAGYWRKGKSIYEKENKTKI